MFALNIEELIVKFDEVIDNHYLIHCQLKDHCCASSGCGQLPTRVHTYYDRVIQDLPVSLLQQIFVLTEVLFIVLQRNSVLCIVITE